MSSNRQTYPRKNKNVVPANIESVSKFAKSIIEQHKKSSSEVLTHTNLLNYIAKAQGHQNWNDMYASQGIPIESFRDKILACKLVSERLKLVISEFFSGNSHYLGEVLEVDSNTSLSLNLIFICRDDEIIGHEKSCELFVKKFCLFTDLPEESFFNNKLLLSEIKSSHVQDKFKDLQSNIQKLKVQKTKDIEEENKKESLAFCTGLKNILNALNTSSDCFINSVGVSETLMTAILNSSQTAHQQTLSKDFSLSFAEHGLKDLGSRIETYLMAFKTNTGRYATMAQKAIEDIEAYADEYHQKFNQVSV